MATEAAVYKRNLESSILFMQQDHAATLKALHEKIHKLQKRCTDLTFQLTMHGISVENEGDVDSRLMEIQKQLQNSQSNENALQSRLTMCDKKVQSLEHEMRVQKQQHMDEMRNASQNISSLKAEVEAKSNSIAFLTSELHRLKMKQKTEAVPDGPGGVEGGPTIVRRTHPHYNHLPAPPRDMLTNSARMRHRGSQLVASPAARRVAPVPTISTTAINAAEAQVLARTLRVTSASTRSSGSESPDISPFVQRELEVDVPVVEVKKPAPLPPIAAANLGLGERDVRLDERDVRHLVISKRGRHGLTRTMPRTPEVATLAIDQVSDANWKRPSQSHSSEYN